MTNYDQKSTENHPKGATELVTFRCMYRGARLVLHPLILPETLHCLKVCVWHRLNVFRVTSNAVALTLFRKLAAAVASPMIHLSSDDSFVICHSSLSR